MASCVDTVLKRVVLVVLMNSDLCVSAASPPPPSLLQFSPQLPLVGFVARVQESSEYCDVLMSTM